MKSSEHSKFRKLFGRPTASVPAIGLPWALALLSRMALAGPPFVTDDPEPVEHRHWELYVGSNDTRTIEGWSGTAPHLEANYGVVPEVQLHLLAPLAYSAPQKGNSHYGLGDVEIGTKFRFLHEGSRTPQIGTFPLLEIPTGSRSRDLGNGSAEVFVPLWFQKSFEDWTTYGGAGPWFDLDSPEHPWWFFGWLLQRRFAQMLTVGAEIFHLTPQSTEGDRDTHFNVGALIDVSTTHHLLLSAGRSVWGPIRFGTYAAWLITLGA